MKMKENSKGVTLIALVISIIVILILAGATITIMLGHNGLLFKVDEASNETKEANDEDKIRMAYVSIMTDRLAKGDNEPITATELEERLKEDMKYEMKDTAQIKVTEEIIDEGTEMEVRKLKVKMPTGRTYTIDGSVVFDVKKE